MLAAIAHGHGYHLKRRIRNRYAWTTEEFFSADVTMSCISRRATSDRSSGKEVIAERPGAVGVVFVDYDSSA